ncbi:MAG TPA: class I SAM-dependent methyltransferase [Trueperaceae bacterium]|nr:class I SAM-dependent methyltransferase [Trueperaceae bacterium]
MQRQYPMEVPALVQAAKGLAGEVDFALRPEGNVLGQHHIGASACIDEVGSLLRALVASLPNGRIGEVGTGAGVGTAWMASALGNGASLTSVELEPRLATAARGLLAPLENVEIITGDWLEVMPRRAPFDLLFFDGGGREALRSDNWPMLEGLLVPGGMMVLDDLTPEELWPDNWWGKPDPKRELAFHSGLFTAAEVRLRTDTAVMLLARR